MAIDLDLSDDRTIEALMEALLAGFPRYEQLENLYYPLLRTPSGVGSLEEFAPNTGVRSVVREIARHVEARGYGLELLAAALIENPTNERLLALAGTVPLRSGDATRDSRRAVALTDLLQRAYSGNRLWQIGRLARLTLAVDPASLETGTGFEARFLPSEFQEPADWRDRLATIERRVCRIVHAPEGVEPASMGTGFLVGPNLVLTNSHVVYQPGPETPRRGFPEQIACQFDYEDGAGAPTLVRLRPDALAMRSPAAALDFALLALAEPVGEARGWEEPRKFVDPEPGEAVFVLQHPGGRKLRLAAGAVVAPTTPSPTRLSYLANTEPGSSGSPCFTVGWRLAALHHFSGESANIGVRMGAVAEALGTALA